MSNDLKTLARALAGSLNPEAVAEARARAQRERETLQLVALTRLTTEQIEDLAVASPLSWNEWFPVALDRARWGLSIDHIIDNQAEIELYLYKRLSGYW